MPILTSIIASNTVQADGRRWIQERHTDHVGGIHDVYYLAESTVDAAAMLPVRAGLIEAQLAAAEIAANVEEALGDAI